MSTPVSWPVIGGTTYSVPASGEVNWPALSNYLIALAGAQSTTNQKTAVRVAASSPVTVVSASDCVVITNLTVAGAVAVNLPAGVSGQLFVIADGKGDAATNNITITPNGVETINGAASYVIGTNRGAVMVSYQTASGWVIVAEFSQLTGGSTGSGLLVRQTSPTINTPTIGTSLTGPLVIGGTGAGSTLSLRSTSGVGTTDQILFQVGNNGGTSGGSIDTTGAWTVGPSAGLGTAVGHLIYGPIKNSVASGTAQLSMSGQDRAFIGNNIYRDSAAAAVRSLANAAGYSYMQLDRSATSTDTVVSFVANADTQSNGAGGAAITTSQITLGSSTLAGVWTFGPTTGTNIHSFQGATAIVQVRSNGSNGSAFRFNENGTYKAQIAYTDSSEDVTFETTTGGTVGSFSQAGAWNIGPSGATTALQVQTINGKINNQISNASLIYRSTGNFHSTSTGATTVLSYSGAADSGTCVMITLRVTEMVGSSTPSIYEYYASIVGSGPTLSVSAGTAISTGLTAGTFAWSGANLQFTRGGTTDNWAVDIVVTRRNTSVSVAIA